MKISRHETYCQPGNCGLIHTLLLARAMLLRPSLVREIPYVFHTKSQTETSIWKASQLHSITCAAWSVIYCFLCEWIMFFVRFSNKHVWTWPSLPRNRIWNWLSSLARQNGFARAKPTKTEYEFWLSCSCSTSLLRLYLPTNLFCFLQSLSSCFDHFCSQRTTNEPTNWHWLTRNWP